MQPHRLVIESNQQPVALACAKCGTVYVTHNQSEETVAPANKCCLCCECGKNESIHGGLNSFCNDCQLIVTKGHLEARAKHLADRIAAAKRVPLAEYTGAKVCFGDDDFRNVDDLRDNPKLAPRYWAWGTTPKRYSFDVDEVLRSYLDDTAYEHAWDSVDQAPLTTAQELVTEALRNVVSYEQDDETIVLICEAEGT